jgi:sugar phosphate isomerase/epimerase
MGRSFVMPFSNVLHLSFEDKLRATQKAGFGNLSIQPQEVRKLNAEGLPVATLRAMADDSGIRISRLDPLCDWVPSWHPTNMDDAFTLAHDIDAVDFFKMALELNCTHTSLNATFPYDRYDVDELVEHYAAICRLAGEFGLICDLENIPMWGVRGLGDAWTIVSRSGAPNGGLVFDSLHFVRSRSTLETLASIPGERIHCVQVSDGPARLPTDTTLEEECFFRLWPGEGEFPLCEMMQVLAKTGGLNQVCAEVFSYLNRERSADEIGVLSAASVWTTLDRAKVISAIVASEPR